MPFATLHATHPERVSPRSAEGFALGVGSARIGPLRSTRTGTPWNVCGIWRLVAPALAMTRMYHAPRMLRPIPMPSKERRSRLCRKATFAFLT
jgi:hypothetical protein